MIPPYGHVIPPYGHVIPPYGHVIPSYGYRISPPLTAQHTMYSSGLNAWSCDFYDTLPLFKFAAKLELSDPLKSNNRRTCPGPPPPPHPHGGFMVLCMSIKHCSGMLYLNIYSLYLGHVCMYRYNCTTNYYVTWWCRKYCEM